MEKLDGMSILVGTARCNAQCPECAGTQHQKDAPQRDGELDDSRLREALDFCLTRDCRYITLTGSGEPTLSPLAISRSLLLLYEYEMRGKKFHPINLYTNGIRIGRDRVFCEKYLPRWLSWGLSAIYVSVYSADENRNAKALGRRLYPSFDTIFKRIKSYGFKLRVNVVLKKGYVDRREKFEDLCKKFFAIGVNTITAWQLRDENNHVSPLAPDGTVLADIRMFANANPTLPLRLLWGENADKEHGRKIALFQNGELSDEWCKKR